MIPKWLVALVISVAMSVAHAQTYPVKPITVIVPFAAGGPGDAMMRSFAQVLGKQLKQSLLIENAGGASGNVGAARAARAARAAPAMTDLLGRQIDLLCDGAATATTQIRAGKVKVFGVSGLRHLPTLPDIPTLDEQGMKGFDMVVWNAMYAPKNTARPAMERLIAAFQVAMVDPDFSSYLERVGSQPVPREMTTSAGLQGYVKSEVGKWTSLLRAAGAPQE